MNKKVNANKDWMFCFAKTRFFFSKPFLILENCISLQTETALWRNWIAHLITAQKVSGLNPDKVTKTKREWERERHSRFVLHHFLLRGWLLFSLRFFLFRNHLYQKVYSILVIIVVSVFQKPIDLIDLNFMDLTLF